MRTKRAGHGRISRRRRRERMKRRKVRAVLVAGVLLLGVLAMAPPLRAYLMGLIRGSVQAFAPEEEMKIDVTLEARRICALQLGVYDNGEHAQAEVSRLRQMGVPCVIWQREQMRLIGDVQTSRSLLNTQAAQGLEAWVIEEELPQVVLRIHAKTGELDAAAELLRLPDCLLDRLCSGKEMLFEIVEEAESKADHALEAHQEPLIYTQLAQSLANWCALMREVDASYPAQTAQAYARATMCMLCIELRAALIEEGAQSFASAASAQRTPSTAADVMPPA